MLDTVGLTPTKPAIDPPLSMEVAGQQLTLFFNTESQLELMLSDIRSAAERVWLETYIFVDDRVGRPIADALKERASAGVDVRLHYDAVGCLVASSNLFTELAAAGVKLNCFHSAWECLRRFAFFRTYNRRNHRKLLVVDHRAGYFGGMNIVDHTSEAAGDCETRPPAAIGWRDLHCRLEGSEVEAIAASFEASWNRSLKRNGRSRKQTTSLQKQLHREIKRLGARQRPDSSSQEWICFFDSGLGQRCERSARVFLQLMNAARRQLTLSMAYFLPVGSVLRALFRCRKRRVNVTLIVPSFSDMPLIYRATRYLTHVLLRRRFEVYERSHCMLHSKVMIVDEEYVVLGSSNFDMRSLWINWEFLAVIRSKRLAAALSEVIQREIQASCRITHDDWRGQPWWQRLLDRCAWSLRRWL